MNINTSTYWDWRYDVRNYPSAHPEHFKRLKAVFDLCDGRVLDVGCGEGFLVNMLALSGRKAVGVDHSKVGIAHAKAGLASWASFQFQAVGEFHEAEAHSLPFDDLSFDTVVATELLEHVNNMPGVISELKRVCCLGGRVIITVPLAGYPREPEHIRDVPLADLQALFSDFHELEGHKYEGCLMFCGRRLA